MFSNKGYTYTVVAGLTRDFPDDDATEIGAALFGGVVVHHDNQEIANLTCDPRSISIIDMSGLDEAKNQLGYVWNSFDQEWVALPD